MADPEFYYDPAFQRVMFACPHDSRFGTLPSCIWEVKKIEPLTVIPSVHNSRCGCHGFITDGKWVPIEQARRG